jgi:hypothetical protein
MEFGMTHCRTFPTHDVKAGGSAWITDYKTLSYMQNRHRTLSHAIKFSNLKINLGNNVLLLRPLQNIFFIKPLLASISIIDCWHALPYTVCRNKEILLLFEHISWIDCYSTLVTLYKIRVIMCTSCSNLHKQRKQWQHNLSDTWNWQQIADRMRHWITLTYIKL